MCECLVLLGTEIVHELGLCRFLFFSSCKLLDDGAPYWLILVL